MTSQALTRLVHEYQAQGHLDNHLAFYRNLPTLEASIETAAMARLWNGKRHSHQRRIPGRVLEQVKNNLLEHQADIAHAADFDSLYHIIEMCREPGFGELAIYDTALRIGVRLGKTPQRVYLHAGTRAGARALGLDGDGPYVELTALPQPLHTLSAHAVEDFLCIHKERLAQLDDEYDIMSRHCQGEGDMEGPVERTCMAVERNNRC